MMQYEAMRLYHFLSQRWGIDNIQRRRMKIATLDNLNDPFEMVGVATQDSNDRKAFQLTKDELALRFGMLCFSANWNNPVQWSHYADRHRGICLGFDVPNEITNKVIYVRKRPIFERYNFSNLNERDKLSFIKNNNVTKFIHWKYENEFRSFSKLIDKDGEFWYKNLMINSF